ncbi:adenylyltransferase [Endozoicomonas montiporae]|uniref:Multifunctional fusion protein n=2 Tax=Endozoicomonas montiporae TaxID=1027273 RepID=A0A081N721_9GAMM|nr:sulfate adenylyltransferase subunit CysN [Endozoicomonas montiporae]AMO55941.1 bifunctional sulfate adenylyltransferase subunit 1/adenylylsulfate kinase [Endozoicomonas montiporae CL-33]KEQ14244.1 adenylyltransferase [Endozoicomonas montiporae]
MAHVSDLIATDIDAYLTEQEHKSFMRLITCGSVDDGKSTLIGRLLFDAKMIFEDQLAALEADSKQSGTTGEAMDLALLVDGLAAEREQGITIDVAYRYFSTDNRKFIIADTPGHEQYTRNMATGASTADLAIILIDARKGVLTQTRRHSYIASLLGIRHVVLAVNKMDLVDYSQTTFDAIRQDYQSFAEKLGFSDITAIPISALKGDNILQHSGQTGWYQGPALMEFLEQVDVTQENTDKDFRMPVQWVNRPDLDFRGFSGTIAAGSVKVGDDIVALPGGKRSCVKSIVTYDGELPAAICEQAVTITLEDEIDISRGDVLAAAKARPEVTNSFATDILWMDDHEMVLNRPYLIRLENNTVPGRLTDITYKINVNTLEQQDAEVLTLNEVARCELALTEDIAFDPYEDTRSMGSFVIVDRITNKTVGCGMLRRGLDNAANVHWHALDLDQAARARAKEQKPVVLWFTGLSGSGKSTIANLVEKKLFARGNHTYTLDGDNVRHGLNKDLGFTKKDRVENIRRISEVANLMTDAGLITLSCFISPFRADRQQARELCGASRFIEVFIDTPLEACEKRDPKGLYHKARKGLIKNFTGLDSPYEAPLKPEIHIKTLELSPEKIADRIVSYLDREGFLTT